MSYSPTATEQLLLTRLNAIRANPAAYGQQIGIDLSAVRPAPPLAWHQALIKSAKDYAARMAAAGFYGHIDPGYRSTPENPFVGTTPLDRGVAAGYPSFFGRDAKMTIAGCEPPD